MAKLGEYVNIKTGKLDANASSENGKYPFFTCAIEPLKIDTYSYDCECVLVAGNGDLNVKYYIGKFDAYQRTYIIESCDKSKLYVPYMYYFLDKYVETLRKLSIGGVIKYIKLGNLTDAEIPIPELSIQKKIVFNLDKVTHTIDLCNAILEKLDLLVKSRFVEMFGDFKINSRGWSIAQFTDRATRDGNMTTDFEKYANYPHIGIDSIEKDTGDLKGYRTVAEDNVVSGKYLFTPNHIIYSKIRPNLNKVALPSFHGVCSADAYPILPNSYNCNRIFLAYVMRSSYFLDYILQFCSRTNLPKVNRKEVSGFTTPLPPLDLQIKFAAFVAQTDKSKLAVKQVIEKAQTLKKALMQEYFG